MHLLLLALLLAAPEDPIGPFEQDLVVAPPAAAEEAAAPDAASDESAEDEDEPAEAESETAAGAEAGPDIRYTKDLSDAELQRLWTTDLAALGTISVGFADQGRMINAVHMDSDPAWICERADLAWGARETVDALETAFRAVHQKFPDSAPARLSHIGAKEGGYLRPHRSHQSGRDADIGFFYKSDKVPRRGARRDRLMDLPRNWALIRALLTQTDVQFILVDRGVQKVLREYAVSVGEDREWVASLFAKANGQKPMIMHARRHKDHFHVRFYAPRSQELGRRIQPLLAQRPEQNLAFHTVRRGQTLGHIARIYDTTVKAIQKANHMRGTMLHLSQRLLVPLRKPCTKCPLPPPVAVPARHLPPASLATATN
ncbi:MAG TPA: penicillin-insensitive murein endopeptidase [Myxococcales bacterium]|nr:penicillin-insensitive murein endopeptidase [Myxococcales bacterium]